MALLELSGISKSFSGVRVLHQVDLTVRAGEVHALIGENGAGKSTLIKLLSGIYPPDFGTISMNNTRITLNSPLEAHRAGIRTLYQESNLLPELSVAENIFLGSEPRHKWLPLIDWREMCRQTSDLLDLLGAEIPPEKRVGSLNPSEQQMVELAKALHIQTKLLIMDEPTASLSRREAENMFRVIRLLQAQGLSIIYITHRLDEVLTIADRVTILREGRRIVTIRVAESTTDQLIHLMSNRTIGQRFTQRVIRARGKPGKELLRVEGLTNLPVFQDISFNLRAGEIVGLAGLVGSGRSALVQSIFGFEPPTSGMIYVDGQPIKIRTPQDAIAQGIGLLPEDRQQQALLLEMTARENMSLAAIGRAGPLINSQQEVSLMEQYTQRLRIKLPDGETKMRFLSGGTQQKIILSRWLAVHPKIMILDEPTRGIDVSAKAEIYRLLGELAEKGIAILVVSSEITEIVRLCDRALVMHLGRLTNAVEGPQLTEEILTRYVMGDAS